MTCTLLKPANSSHPNTKGVSLAAMADLVVEIRRHLRCHLRLQNLQMLSAISLLPDIRHLSIESLPI